MKRILKLFGKTLLVLAAIPLAFYLVLVLYNLRDDPLDPELEKLLATVPPQIDPAKNGYFAWIGVFGAVDQPPHVWGQRWHTQALEADKRRPSDPNEVGTLTIDAERVKHGLNSKDIACASALESCLESVAAKPEQARAILEKGKVLLARGDAALAYPAYQEAWRPDFVGFSYSPGDLDISIYRHLSATRFALAVLEGRDDEALDQLGQKMAFHTKQLQGAALFPGYVAALTSLRADYLLLNQYLVSHPAAAKARVDQLGTVLAPLPADALRLKSVLLNENQSHARLLMAYNLEGLRRSPGKDTTFGSILLEQLYLPRATANEIFRLIQPVLAADALDGAAYREKLAKANSDVAANSQDIYVLRNPAGRNFVSPLMTPSYNSFFRLRDDVAMLQASVALQLELMRQNADETTIGQAVSKLVHPFTGAAPLWDGAKRRLNYPALPERGNKPLTLHF